MTSRARQATGDFPIMVKISAHDHRRGGMNVGGLPGTTAPYGFIGVVGLMVVIGAAEVWYFKRKGWFD